MDTNKQKSKKLKIFGTALLLGAFIVQWTLINAADEKLRLQKEAYDLYASSYNSSLIYANMYFNIGQTTEKYDGNILKKAARENATGLAGRLAVSSLTKETKVASIKKAYAKANQVTDLDSYNEYIRVVNAIEEPLYKEREKDVTKLAKKKSSSSYIYTALYILGSLLLLWGMRWE